MSGASTAEPAATAGASDSEVRDGAAHQRRTIVVGLGNPVLGDDGAGWVVADAVEVALAATRPDVRIERLAAGGLTLMERLMGFHRAIVVDALLTGMTPPGTVRRLRLEDLPGREAGHADSAHDTSLATALAAGRALGADVPDRVELVTIEVQDVLDLREGLSPTVAAAVPVAAAAVLDLLGA